MSTLTIIILIFSSCTTAVYDYTDPVCVNEHYSYNINGKYVHYYYSSSIPGDVYYCSSCGGAVGVYIYPLKIKFTSDPDEVYHWVIGPTFNSTTGHSICQKYTYFGLRSLMYQYLINDCELEWLSYTGSDWVADYITIDPCPDTTNSTLKPTTTSTTTTTTPGPPIAPPTTTTAYHTTNHITTSTIASSDIEYDAFINISYVIADLSLQNLISFEDAPTHTLSNVIRIIKFNYLYILKNVIQIHDLMIYMNNVNGYNDVTQIRLRRGDNITINCHILSYSDLIGILIRTSKDDSFQEAARDDLITYFNNDTKLNVFVKNILYEETSLTNEPTETMESYEIIVVSMCILAVGFICSIVIKISNSRKNSIADNAKWLAPLFFSFQVFDFISDISLSYDILSNPLIYSDDILITNNIFWVGIASVIFIVVPFISNLFFGIFISKQKIIQNNQRAETYFTNDMMIFIPFIVISAGCHPALMMVSSRIFDLDSLSCGLTKHELYKLLKIKVYSTIIFEDMPQLIIQIIYASATTTISSAVLMAFIASLLSIITTISIYIAYKVSTKDAEIISYHLKFYNKNETPLTPHKKKQIVNRKGRTEELEKLIAEEFNISRINIEIGYITQISEGIQLYIVQFIHKNQLTSFDNAVSYLEQFYTRHENINIIFRKHFSINDSNFTVQFVNSNHVKTDVVVNKLSARGYTEVTTEEINDNVDHHTS